MPVYRPASPADDGAHELLGEYFAMRSHTFPEHLGEYRTVFPDPEKFVPPAGIFFVVEDESGPVGCGGVRMLDTRRAEIKHLYLRERARGKGWGRELLAELEAHAVGLGARELVLDTNASLEAAQGLYRSSGYADIEPYNDNPNADLWLRKGLGNTEGSAVFCPRCGAILRLVHNEWTCEPGDCPYSQHAFQELRRIALSEPDTPAASTWPIGGRWHCPRDGQSMRETDGVLRCTACFRSIPRGLVTELIELNPHAAMGRNDNPNATNWFAKRLFGDDPDPVL